MSLNMNLEKAKSKLHDFFVRSIENFLLVDIENQKLTFVKNNVIFKMYPVSTSRYGIGSKENSLKTPQGIHRIIEKIGHNAPIGRIFKDRIDTGTDWTNALPDDNIILSRILRLEGLELGINKGPGIDSFERYIYIHGTNHESKVGTPNSHGCVCMKNADIIELFDHIEVGTIVLID